MVQLSKEHRSSNANCNVRTSDINRALNILEIQLSVEYGEVIGD